MVFLKSRVRGMVASPISLFVSLPVGGNGADMVALALLGAVAQQDNQTLAILAEISPVSGSEIDHDLENT